MAKNILRSQQYPTAHISQFNKSQDINGCDQKGVLHWLRIMQKWLLEKRMQWHNYPWLTIRFPWKTLPSLSGFSSVQSWKLWKKKQTNTLVWVQFDYYYYCVRAEKDTMGRRPKTRNIEKEADTVCYIYIYICILLYMILFHVYVLLSMLFSTCFIFLFVGCLKKNRIFLCLFWCWCDHVVMPMVCSFFLFLFHIMFIFVVLFCILLSV